MALDGSESHADAFGTVSGTAYPAATCSGFCLVMTGIPGLPDAWRCGECPRSHRRVLTTRDAAMEKSKAKESPEIG